MFLSHHHNIIIYARLLQNMSRQGVELAVRKFQIAITAAKVWADGRQDLWEVIPWHSQGHVQIVTSLSRLQAASSFAALHAGQLLEAFA